MSKVSIGALLAFVCILPLGCEAIVGNVHGHDDAGAGGVGGEQQGEAGMPAVSGAGNAPGDSGAGGTPAEAGASGANVAGASGETGDSGAAGASPGCVPIDDGNPCTEDVCKNGFPEDHASPAGTACHEGDATLCDGQGACVECLQASDCSGEDTACQTRTCTRGTCGFTYAAVGTPLPTQTVGDCKTAQCDGHGAIVQANNDADLPVDNNACTSDVCSAGVPSNPNQSEGTPCGTALLCNANGTCVGCNTASDCGTNTECKTFTCSNSQCGISYTATGTAAGTQTAGNCQKSACDGAGNISNVADATDTPADDGNACTDETCVSGAPQHPNKSNGTACSDGNGCTLADTCQSGTCTAGAAKVCTALDQCHTAGTCTPASGSCSTPLQPAGTFCNGTSVCTAAGACVQCNTASDCPGTDTECKARTCTSNQCGMSYPPAGTVTAVQTAGNCQKNQCDGSGNIVSLPDNADLPADDGIQCTSEACAGGVASHPPKALNTTCNQLGGTYCDGGTSCVQCTAASQCPGTDTTCHSRTCSAGQCDVSNVAANTSAGAAVQTPGDCQKVVCDGNGGVTSVDDLTDVPVDDGNECTDPTCSGNPAMPSYSPKDPTTTCDQNGGTLCDGAGNCTN